MVPEKEAFQGPSHVHAQNEMNHTLDPNVNINFDLTINLELFSQIGTADVS